MTHLTAALTPADYVDPDVHSAEVERVLRAGWLPLCRRDQLREPGDRVAATLAGVPVVAVRDHDAAIRVLVNVCPHRGSTIVDDGAGCGSTLVCPYHRWAFRLDGSFVGAPLAEGADLDGVALDPVRHHEWQGFVLVNLSGDAPEPDLAGLDAEIGPWRWDELVTVGSRTFTSTWSWKVMVENWIECYHHVGTHRESLEPLQPARTTALADPGAAPWVAMTVEGIEEMAGEPGAWIPGLPAHRARDLSVWAAFPLLLGGSISTYGFWLQVLPDAVDRHTVTWHLLAHPDRLDEFTPEVVDADLDLLAMVHAEDVRSCERVHAGLASGRAHRARLTELEAPIAHFQRWVAHQLGRGG